MEYGLRLSALQEQANEQGLNPCCNGIWSQTNTTTFVLLANKVLILVVMEYGLRHSLSLGGCCADGVLILVVMEYGLRRQYQKRTSSSWQS